MSYVIMRIDSGDLLAAFDPNWQPDPPPATSPWWHCGRADWIPSEHVESAVKFESAPDAWKLWGTQSTRYPFRGDGKPNRPLTAISCMVLPEEDVARYASMFAGMAG